MNLPAPITIFVVDDENLARERLKRLIALNTNFRVCGEAEHGEQALQGIYQANPDIVLLDVRMPGIDGLEVAHRLSELEHPPAVIFCTAYDEYAIKAFKYHAVGYLLKPVRKEELDLALKQAKQLNKLQLKQLTSSPGDAAETFVANTWQGHELIDLDDIYFFRADQKYLTVVHRQGETLSDQTLKELTDRYPSKLLRVHRNTLVNIAHIGALRKTTDGHYQIVIKESRHCIAVSRRHVADIKSQLGASRS